MQLRSEESNLGELRPQRQIICTANPWTTLIITSEKPSPIGTIIAERNAINKAAG